MSLEQELREKLRRILALYQGAKTVGERDAAAAAANRIRKRLNETAPFTAPPPPPRPEPKELPVEYRFTLGDEWSRKLFAALCRRYGLRPFRYRGQRYTTVMVLATPSFVDKTLWPEYLEIERELRKYLSEITERIIREEVFGDATEAKEQ